MKTFEFTRPPDAGAAIATASHSKTAQQGADVRFIAGGTTLVDLMKLNVETPARVLDINRLPLDKIDPTSDGGFKMAPQLATRISRIIRPSGGTTRSFRRPISTAPQPNCATWRRPPAISSSALAACIFATPPCLATSASPAR